MTPPVHLTFVEELVLLGLDDRTGALLPMPVMGFNYALAGALLADLALAGRIDTDLEQLTVIRDEPTGDSMLDAALDTIKAAPGPLPVAHWLGVLSSWRPTLENEALARLVGHGILRREDKKILRVFGTRRYPTVNHQERTEVKTRLSALILGDDIPDPRDAVLISLLTACHLAQHIFTDPACAARSTRLANLARMDQVGREVGASLDLLTRVLMSAHPMGM
ncbi:phosphoprotein [Opitutaceae bacterium TAV5]|nr:phosphoprotein [Opitutaceae bacterium TAV5]